MVYNIWVLTCENANCSYRQKIVYKKVSPECWHKNWLTCTFPRYGHTWRYTWGYQLYIFQHKTMKPPPLCSPATHEAVKKISSIQIERTAAIQSMPTLVHSLSIELMDHQKNNSDVLGHLWSSSVKVNKRKDGNCIFFLSFALKKACNFGFSIFRSMSPH